MTVQELGVQYPQMGACYHQWNWWDILFYTILLLQIVLFVITAIKMLRSPDLQIKTELKKIYKISWQAFGFVVATFILTAISATLFDVDMSKSVIFWIVLLIPFLIMGIKVLKFSHFKKLGTTQLFVFAILVLVLFYIKIHPISGGGSFSGNHYNHYLGIDWTWIFFRLPILPIPVTGGCLG